ncbi:MAG: kelch repeat-containing protein, partial [Vicinamibacterales bacterium]
QAVGTNTVYFTPAPDYHGAASFDYAIGDGHGGTATATVNVTVLSVNDAPSFVKGPDQSSGENGGPQTVPGWATAITTGPATANEGAQSVSFVVSNNNHFLFSAQPTVSPSGTLTYTAAPSGAGTATVTVTVQDDGGTDNGGVDASASQTFTITIGGVNDPPSFTAGPSQNIAEDSPLQTVTNWATYISAGPPDESGQLIDFIVSNNSSALFMVQPSVSPDGTLTYRPAANASGVATVTVSVHDNGGSAPGVDTSAPQTFTIAVYPVNDLPVAVNDTVSATAGQESGFNVLANDFDVESPTGSVVATVPFQPSGLPANFAFPAEAAVVNSTGQVYISSGRYLGALDPATHTVTSATPLAIVGAPSLSVVNQSTGYIYFRQNTSILAYDTASGSVAATLRLGGFQSFDLDEGRGLLYVSYTVSGLGPNTSSQPAVAAIDVNPGHTTFHQLIYTAALPPGFSVFGVAVNPATNKIYIASNAASGGVFVLDGASHALSQIAGSVGAATIVVNPASNLVFAGQLVSPNSGSIEVIDPLNGNAVSLVAVPGFVNSTTAPNKHLAVNTLTGRVYARSFDTDLTHTGNVFVIDGDRLSPTFKTVLASIPIGIDGSSDDLVVDEGLDKVVATSGQDFRIVVIDGASHAAITIAAGQGVGNIALVPGTHHAFVTGFLSMLDVDLATSSLAATVDVGAEAEGVVVDPSSHLAYVGRANGAASVVKLNKDGLVGTLPGLPTTSGRYSFLAADPALHRLFVLDSDSNLAATNAAMPAFVSVVDTTTNAVMTNIPVGRGSFGMGINPVNHRVYVGGNSSSTVPASITVIDGTNNSSTTANTSAFTEPGVSFLRDFVPNTTTGKVYFRVSGSSSGITAGVISTGNVATTLPPTLGSIVLIKVNSTLNRVYLGTSNGQVVVLDGANDSVVTTLNTGSPSTTIGTQSYLAVDESNGHVYVADFNDDSMTIFDGTTNAELAVLGVGRGPTSVAVNSTTHRVYVGNTLDPSITFIDGTALMQSGFLPTPMVPNFIAVDDAESRIYTSSGSSVLAPTGAMVIADSGSTAHLTVNGTTNGNQGPVSIFAGQYVIYEPAIGASGSDTFTYTITDGQATSPPATVTVNITPPLTITTASLPEGTAGSAYAQILLASGGVPPYVWTVASGALPGGIVMTSGGAIMGVPATPGNFTFTVLVTDSSAIRPQTTSRVLTLPVGPLAILTNSLGSAQINQPYSFTMTVGGGTATPLVWTLNTNNNPLLNWLSISSAGVLAGTPSTYGTTPSFTITVTDALSHSSAPRSYTIFVGGPLELTPAPREGVVLETQPSLSIVGGSGTKTATLTGGALPPGLTLLSTGSFTGTPTRHGNYNFTVELRDCTPSTSCSAGTSQQVVTRNLALRVSAKDQQGSSASQPAITFGGIVPGSRTMAQVVTVGAQGTLTGVGLQNITCPSVTPLTVSIQRLTLSGLPDGNTVATGTATSNYNAITVTPPLPVAIDERLAFIVSSPVACTFANAPTIDTYNGGDAFVDAGSGWVSLFSTDGRYDLPSFRTLIQPAIDVAYLNVSRGGLTATLLNNGKVLLAGASNALAAELYDPATNTSTVTANMSVPRTNHTATLLADGRVLIVGGRDSLGNRTVTAEIYDPVSATFSSTGSLVTVRENHAATLLPDGRVLVTGGNDGTGNGVNYAEVFDPTANSGVGAFTLISSMSTPRSSHTSTLLANGKVLVTGGYYNFVNKGDLFNPATNTFTPTAGAMVVPFRGRATATLLNDGKVLIAGGQPNDVTSTAEIYDPVADTFTATPSVMVSKRYFHTATLLADGSVLIAGGFDQTSSASYILALATAERYLPGSGIFVPAGGLEARRYSHAAVRLADNRVLLAGGFASTWMSGNTVEVYEPGAVPSLFPSFLSDGQLGVPYTPFTLQGTYGVAPYQIDHVGGALPSGMAFASNTLSGTPGAIGRFPLAFRVTDNAGHTNTQTLPLTIGTPHVITSPYSLPNGALNQTYTVPLTATGTPSIVWTMLPASNSLPPGLNLTAGGVITGAPTSTGFYSFGVRAVDGQGLQAVKTLSINVTSAMTITTPSLADPVAGGTYGNCMSRSNGVGPYTWSLTGPLPAGMAFVPSTGCFASVYPTNVVRQTGSFSVNISVVDSSSPPQVVSQPYTFKSHAIDQLGSSGPGGSISFGGAGGRSVAQVFTVGAQGGLSGVGLQNMTCGFNTTVTVEIQRLTMAGLPDGVTIASGSGILGYQTMQVTPVLDFPIDTRLAMVVTSSSACSLFSVPTNDAYMGGDAFVNAGSGWVSLLGTDGRYDLPNFRTLIQPALPVYYPNTYKDGTAAALLNDGKVLLAGGYGNTQVEVYDPVANTTAALANMPIARLRAPVIVLNDGKVFIPGGTDQNGFRISSAATFDPATGAFTSSLNNMSSARQYHTATLLPDGKVLVAGGMDSSGNTLRTAQVYDPATRTFGSSINMLAFRNAHTAALLGNGKVLIAGGYGPGSNQTAELYDPALNTFTATTGGMVENRAYHTATVLPGGNVLLAGGQWTGVMNTAEIYNPLTDTFAATGSMSIPRINHTATLLAEGSVLIAGGIDQNGVWNYVQQQATSEVYVPGSGTFVPGAGLETRRYMHSALRLNDGRVFLVGGNSSSWMTGSSAEFYDPAGALSISPLTLANGQATTSYPPVTFTSTGGTGPRQISLVSGAIPSGMTFDGPTATLSGTPNTNGRYVFGLRVTDSASHASTQSFTLRVGGPTITSPYRLSDGAIGQPYSVPLVGTGAPALAWALPQGGSNVLPTGLTLSSTGLISGTPTSTGFYTIAVRLTDGDGLDTVKTHGIQINSPLTFNTTTLGDGIAGQTYGGCIGYNNGQSPITWSLSGQVPPGLAIQSNGCFDTSTSHTIRAGGSFTFTVTAEDSSSPHQVVSRSYSIRMHGSDQAPYSFNSSSVSLPSTRRVAETFRSGTPYGISGVELFSIQSCTVNTQVTAGVYPVTGSPARPDTSGSPMATASVTASSGSFFNGRLLFASPVAMPRGTPFAVVLSFANGTCQSPYWPPTDTYPYGDGWVDDGLGWQQASTAIGRKDVVISTLAIPDARLAFAADWLSRGVSATLTDGRVLVIGSSNGAADLYDPSAATPTLVSTAGAMLIARNAPTATRLPNGKVLIVGGTRWDGAHTVAVASTEIFDPASGTFSAGGNLPEGRTDHSATVVSISDDDYVLITGGYSFDGSFNAYGPTTAVLLDLNGNVVAQLPTSGSRVH